MRTLIIFSILFMLLSFKPNCSCVKRQLDNEDFKNLEFIGKVEILNTSDSFGYKSFQVRVLEEYKSFIQSDTFNILTYTTSCESSFEVGKKYLICADTFYGNARTDLCYNNYILDPMSIGNRKENLEKDLKFLRRKSFFKRLFNKK